MKIFGQFSVFLSLFSREREGENEEFPHGMKATDENISSWYWNISQVNGRVRERKNMIERERDRDARAIDRVILWKKGRKIYCIFPFPRFDNSLQYWMWLMYREWVKRELEMDPLQRLICEEAKKFPLCIFIQVWLKAFNSYLKLTLSLITPSFELFLAHSAFIS